ncbi:MAG: DUF4124 domain-containing protein [Xanthomonadales bacterium]|nr:DUF4124 domain-containing protein [Xanthomonadales bacterium]
MSYVDGFVLQLPRKRRLLAWLPLFMVLFLAPWPANAVEVYQWTDENGVVHFSQWAPTEPEKNVSTLEVDGSPPPGYDPEADLYNVEANQKYMESLWSDREKRQEESRERQAASAPQIIQQTITPEYGAWPVYPAYGLRPPLRPDRPDRPEKPVRPEQPLEPPGTWAPKRRDG